MKGIFVTALALALAGCEYPTLPIKVQPIQTRESDPIDYIESNKSQDVIVFKAAYKDGTVCYGVMAVNVGRPALDCK